MLCRSIQRHRNEKHLLGILLHVVFVVVVVVAVVLFLLLFDNGKIIFTLTVGLTFIRSSLLIGVFPIPVVTT